MTARTGVTDEATFGQCIRAHIFLHLLVRLYFYVHLRLYLLYYVILSPWGLAEKPGEAVEKDK